MYELSPNIDNSYTQALSKEQWAWEFLRRNPEYQLDYQWFMEQWKALEKDYGCAPDVDYQSWKQDPRSYKVVDISNEQDGNCAISDDKLLIECWMGNKWGFYQFPKSPQLSALELEMTWRALPPDYQAPDNPVESDKKQLIQKIEFDLSKSLKEQLEQAKHQVVIHQRQLRKQNKLEPFTLVGKKKLWLHCLNFLDNIVRSGDNKSKDANIEIEAEYYLKNYLNILTLLEK